jgi:hypothetical protein
MLHPNLIFKNHRLLPDLNFFLAVFYVTPVFGETKFRKRWVRGLGCVRMCMHVVCTGSDEFSVCR